MVCAVYLAWHKGNDMLSLFIHWVGGMALPHCCLGMQYSLGAIKWDDMAMDGVRCG